MLTFTAIHPLNRKLGVPSRHIPTNKWSNIYEAMLAIYQANRAGWGAYFGIAYRKPGLDRWHRGGRADLLALPALFADIELSPEHLPEKLKDLPKPSWVIRSSSVGSHVYWLLEDFTQELRRADYILHGIAQYLNSDTTMTIDNILRLPGTRNTKPERNSFCEIVEGNPQNRYLLSNFAKWMIIPDTPKQILAPEMPIQPARKTLTARNFSNREILNPSLIEAINQKLLLNYDGQYNKNGWINSYAPCSHKQDRFPGDHFNWNPIAGIGYCYGKHGTLFTHEVANLLGIRISDYGRLFVPIQKAN
jgi:hypothetical protein